MASYRKEKVKAQIARDLSEFIRVKYFEKYGLITITDVFVTSDFKEAKIYISVFDNTQEDEVIKKLSNSSHEFQFALGKKLKTKFTPRLLFIIDNNSDKIEKIDKLFEDISS